MARDEPKIGLIGAGAMGEALATGLVKAGTAPERLCLADVADKRLSEISNRLGVRAMPDNRSLVQESDVVLIAVKPTDTLSALKKLQSAAPDDLARPLWISIAAGVPLTKLQSALSQKARIVRAMPNTPALIGASATAFVVNASANDTDRAIALRIFEAIGRVWEAPSENLLDAVTGLSGSGPAYVFVLLEALADAGVRVGLPRDAAQLLANQTVFGAAKLAIETGLHPSVLKDQVTSPGGTTVAGLGRLEAGAFRAAIGEAVSAATTRSRELGQ